MASYTLDDRLKENGATLKDNLPTLRIIGGIALITVQGLVQSSSVNLRVIQFLLPIGVVEMQYHGNSSNRVSYNT